MMRTPAKKDTGLQGSGGSPRSTERADPSALSVRRSIGEWEAGKTEPKAKSPANSRPEAAPRTTQTLPSTSGMRRASVEAASPAKKAEPKYPNFTAEARACLNKAKLHLSNSRNLKTEIKTEVVAAINRLYEIVKESEKSKISVAATTTSTIDQTVQPLISSHTSGSSLLTSLDGNEELSKKLDENSALIRENLGKMEALRDALLKRERAEEATYACALTEVIASNTIITTDYALSA
ncbi:hypothetical protein PYW07_013953 [Mythimna separata]|uniref:Uncharacterized protein n=1 Tax=Mythimna separata TaxID=271217 RepID=A0AAD8DPC9_MYTSE|nr:hypothetical protein PYW07_013953 [Mythimna separata]